MKTGAPTLALFLLPPSLPRYCLVALPNLRNLEMDSLSIGPFPLSDEWR